MRVNAIKTGIVLLLLAAPVLTSKPAFAGAEGRRNTAIGLGAATLYELGKGHYGTALLFGAGTGVAWHQYDIQRKREAQQTRSAPVYSSGSYNSYPNGGYSTSSYSTSGAPSGGSMSTASSSAAVHHRARAHSGRRFARAVRARHAVRQAHHVSAASVAAMTAQNAAMKQRMAGGEAAMQQNLSQLTTQVKSVKQQNTQLQSQLAAMQQDNEQARQQATRYFNSALLASLIALFGIGGLTIAYFRHPGSAAPHTIIRQAH